MPAGSERPPTTAPELPHTWRPLGVRLAVWVLGSMLLLMFAALWVAIGDETRAQFTAFQRGTLIFLLILLFATWNALVRSRVTATRESLKVVNGYRTRSYEWSQVISVS